MQFERECDDIENFSPSQKKKKYDKNWPRHMLL